MSKTKHIAEIDYRLAGIEETEFSMALPDGFKAAAIFQFHVSLEASVNAEQKKMAVTNKIEVRSQVEGPVLGYSTVKYYFDLVGFEKLEKNKAGMEIIPQSIQLGINSIVLSTTRGILFARFRGTLLHYALLPLIDAANFSVNEVEE